VTQSDTCDARLLRTPLHDFHVRQKARFVAYAGYEMPIQYPDGVLREHLHTRASAGIFDVSHMGQILLKHASGNVKEAAQELEKLVPADIVGLPVGRQRYSMLLNPNGGIADDIMVANLGSHLIIVVNAATKSYDEAMLRDRLGTGEARPASVTGSCKVPARTFPN
jgi:aminomethyltransferase